MIGYTMKFMYIYNVLSVQSGLAFATCQFSWSLIRSLTIHQKSA